MAHLMTFRTLSEKVFKIPAPGNLCKETYRISESLDHFERAISLIRKLAWGARIADWDTEEKNIFSGAITFYSIDKNKIRKAVFKSLTADQVITLLQQVHDIDWLWFNDTKKEWFSELISIKAMASLLDSKGLWVIRDDVFDGTAEMMKWLMFGQYVNSSSNPTHIHLGAMVSTYRMKDVCFPNGIPMNHLLPVIEKLNVTSDPEIFKLVTDTMRSNIDRGRTGPDVTADATEYLLWSNINNIPRYYRLPFIKAIYPDPSALVINPECWTKLIFPQDLLCNTWDEDGDADVSSGEDIPDTPFCTDCAMGSEEDHQPPCTCTRRFHMDICSWLMKESVPIPASFWERVAYYNLYHLAYFLHVDKSELYSLNIPHSAILKCIQFDRLAFAKFLVQFNYFPKDDFIRGFVGPGGEQYTPSAEMTAILQLVSKKRRREDVAGMQSLVDEWKEKLPGGFHIEICNHLHSMYKYTHNEGW